MAYAPVLPPYAHQVEALEKMRDRRAFALLMGMRTGKTKVIIDEWGEKICAGEVRDLLVIAPAGAYRTWEKELKKHLPPEMLESVLVGVWESGGPVSTRYHLESVIRSSDPKRPRVVLVNVEALSMVTKAIAACTEFLEPGKAMIVVDESTSIKNHEALRTRAVCTFSPMARWRRILSGLPTPKSSLDLFSQFWFLDPMILNFRNFYAFRARYAVTKKIQVGRHSATIVVGYRNTEELHDLIAPHSFRRTLDQCYDVPKKAYSFREVDLTLEQKRLYADLKDRATTKLESGEHVTATEVIVQMLRLHQLCCGHLVDEDGQAHDVPSNRLRDLLSLVEDYSGKVIIWCSYARDVLAISAKLRAEYGPESVACFWGGNKETREEDSQRFETDPQCQYMVATPGAGGRGRTWSVAKLLIYYSNTDNLEHRDQSEERASAIGKEDNVTVVDMIAKGTVEEKIVQSLRNKMNMAAVITGDTWREWLV